MTSSGVEPWEGGFYSKVEGAEVGLFCAGCFVFVVMIVVAIWTMLMVVVAVWAVLMVVVMCVFCFVLSFDASSTLRLGQGDFVLYPGAFRNLLNQCGAMGRYRRWTKLRPPEN